MDSNHMELARGPNMITLVERDAHEHLGTPDGTFEELVGALDAYLE